MGKSMGKLRRPTAPTPTRPRRCALNGCDARARPGGFCSDKHAIKWRARKASAKSKLPRAGANARPAVIDLTRDSTLPPDLCGLPGCVARVSRGGFCSSKHEARASARGLIAPPSADVERAFVGASGDHSCLLLTRASPDRAELVAQFVAAWRKPVPPDRRLPCVQRVYRIVAPPHIREGFHEYATRVGNVRRRFHGTTMECSFGIDLASRPCLSGSCSVCRIMEQGFALARAGLGPNSATFGASLRYGAGLYFSSTSGKSNDYAEETERVRGSATWRCMLIAQVAAGRAFCTHEATRAMEIDDQGRARPPDGYDSVVGEVGDHLNYDELVVYHESAALPQYLMMYTV